MSAGILTLARACPQGPPNGQQYTPGRACRYCVISVTYREADGTYPETQVWRLRLLGRMAVTMAKFEKFEYSVTTRAAPDVAWKVFSDWKLWLQFSELYAEIRWTRGEPWQKGSRLSIRIAKPIGVTLDHVITVCVPGEKVAWIDHALGTTMEQWVFFEPDPEGGTCVRTWAEFTGLMPLIAGRRTKDVLLEFTRKWYDRYALECDRVAGAASLSA